MADVWSFIVKQVRDEDACYHSDLTRHSVKASVKLSVSHFNVNISLPPALKNDRLSRFRITVRNVLPRW